MCNQNRNQPLVCCVTGHRFLTEEQAETVRRQLKKQLQLAVWQGYTWFISGFAQGTDLIFAALVLELKKSHPGLILEACIPYRRRIFCRDETFQTLYRQCDIKRIICESYSQDCYFARNWAMVSHSQLVIAVSDGRTYGGTYYTMQAAKKAGRKLKVISIAPDRTGEPPMRHARYRKR